MGRDQITRTEANTSSNSAKGLGKMSATLPFREKVHRQITDQSSSALQRYRQIVVGGTGLGFLARYELATLLFGSFPGAVGLQLRRLVYPSLIARVGKGTIFGRDVVLRHPGKIAIGDNVVVDDGCVLDARGESNAGIVIGNEVMLARQVVLGCKNGDIRVGDGVGIGAYSIVHAIGSSGVTVGNNAVIGAYTYLVGGSHYHYERTDIPIAQQGLDLKGGIRIGDNVWLGARVTVLDGVTVGRDAIVGAGAVVTKDVPDYAIVAGVPARVVGHRDGQHR
jgi:acetyltransferase-like isoleucine patch superfamily enzyme